MNNLKTSSSVHAPVSVGLPAASSEGLDKEALLSNPDPSSFQKLSSPWGLLEPQPQSPEPRLIFCHCTGHQRLQSWQSCLFSPWSWRFNGPWKHTWNPWQGSPGLHHKTHTGCLPRRRKCMDSHFTCKALKSLWLLVPKEGVDSQGKTLLRLSCPCQRG